MSVVEGLVGYVTVEMSTPPGLHPEPGKYVYMCNP